MTTDDRQAFAKTLAAMAAAYDVECDEVMAEGFWLTLNDLPLDRVQAAVLTLMRGSKFRPKAAEIRAIVVDEENAAKRAERQRIAGNESFASTLAYQVARAGAKANASEERIRQELEHVGRTHDITLYWPGEAPWEKANHPEPAQPLELDFEVHRTPRLEQSEA